MIYNKFVTYRILDLQEEEGRGSPKKILMLKFDEKLVYFHFSTNVAYSTQMHKM